MNNLTAFAGSTSREAIRGLSFSPDDQRFATASDDSTVKVWSFGRREVERVLTGMGPYNPASRSQSMNTRSRMGCEMRPVASDKRLTRIRW